MAEAQDECWLHPVSSLVLGVGLEQLPEGSVGSKQRPLPYFPFLSPSSSFLRAAAPRGSFQAKQAQPGTELLFCVPSIPVLPWLLPTPIPDPALALLEIFSPSSISCCFFWRKGWGGLVGIVPWLTPGAASSCSLGAAVFLFLHIQDIPTCGI